MAQAMGNAHEPPLDGVDARLSSLPTLPLEATATTFQPPIGVDPPLTDGVSFSSSTPNSHTEKSGSIRNLDEHRPKQINQPSELATPLTNGSARPFVPLGKKRKSRATFTVSHLIPKASGAPSIRSGPPTIPSPAATPSDLTWDQLAQLDLADYRQMVPKSSSSTPGTAGTNGIESSLQTSSTRELPNPSPLPSDGRPALFVISPSTGHPSQVDVNKQIQVTGVVISEPSPAPYHSTPPTPSIQPENQPSDHPTVPTVLPPPPEVVPRDASEPDRSPVPISQAESTVQLSPLPHPDITTPREPDELILTTRSPHSAHAQSNPGSPTSRQHPASHQKITASTPTPKSQPQPANGLAASHGAKGLVASRSFLKPEDLRNIFRPLIISLASANGAGASPEVVAKILNSITDEHLRKIAATMPRVGQAAAIVVKETDEHVRGGEVARMILKIADTLRSGLHVSDCLSGNDNRGESAVSDVEMGEPTEVRVLPREGDLRMDVDSGSPLEGANPPPSPPWTPNMPSRTVHETPTDGHHNVDVLPQSPSAPVTTLDVPSKPSDPFSNTDPAQCAHLSDHETDPGSHRSSSSRSSVSVPLLLSASDLLNTLPEEPDSSYDTSYDAASETGYKCTLGCRKIFKTDARLVQHLEKGKCRGPRTNVIYCGIDKCSRSYSTIGNLRVHYRSAKPPEHGVLGLQLLSEGRHPAQLNRTRQQNEDVPPVLPNIPFADMNSRTFPLRPCLPPPDDTQMESPEDPSTDDDDVLMSAQHHPSEEGVSEFTESVIDGVKPSFIAMVQPLGADLYWTRSVSIMIEDDWVDQAQRWRDQNGERASASASTRFQINCFRNGDRLRRTNWPSHKTPLFVSINGQPYLQCNPAPQFFQLDRDGPLNVTTLVLQGLNEITISHVGDLSQWTLSLEYVCGTDVVGATAKEQLDAKWEELLGRLMQIPQSTVPQDVPMAEAR